MTDATCLRMHLYALAPMYGSGRHGGLMVSALDSGRGHCVVFLGKTLNYNSASLHPGV